MELNVKVLKRRARLAGILYLFLVLSGLYGLIYLPSKIPQGGDAATTAKNILAHEFLFRTGLVNGMVSGLLFLFVVLALYRLFEPVDGKQARLMVILIVLQIPIGFMLELFPLTSLMILNGEALKVLEPGQKEPLALLLLEIANQGTRALELFWGLWLFPFAWLVWKSGFIPRILGLFLMLNGLAYILEWSTFLLFPSYKALVRVWVFPFFFGELAITLWLLIVGIRIKPVKYGSAGP